MESSSLGCPPAESFSDTHIHLEAAQKGERNGYERLLERFGPGLQTILAVEIHRTHGTALRARLRASAEDLLQETVKKGFEKIGEIEYLGPGSVMAYFAQILRNRIHNFREFWTAEIRDVGREVEAPGAGMNSTFVPADPAAPNPGPPTVFQLSQDRQRVAEALARLDDRHREILVLRFFGGASWSEVAARVGIVSADAARMECRNNALPAFALALSR